MNIVLTEIGTKIREVRNQKVLLDFDLAHLYGTETRILKQAVKRNIDRFPTDFMFELTKKEWQQVITICDNLPEKARFSPVPPFAFTEQGVVMLSSVLNSQKAIQVNITIMRTFVLLRQYALTYKDLTDKLKELENKYDQQFSDVYEALNYLLDKDKITPVQQERARIGF